MFSSAVWVDVMNSPLATATVMGFWSGLSLQTKLESGCRLPKLPVAAVARALVEGGPLGCTV
jgi:hypothetical protein